MTTGITMKALLIALLFAGVVAAQETPQALDGEIRRVDAAGIRGMETPVTIDIREADLAQAVRILAQQAGINIAIGKDVKGTVTCSLVNVSARTALQAFLRANGYDVIQSGDVLVVVSQEAQKAFLPSPVSAPHRIVRRTFSLPYTGTERDAVVSASTSTNPKSGDGGGYSGGGGGSQTVSGKPVEEIIRGMLSAEGKLAYYERQHILIVEDDEAAIKGIEEFVNLLWTPPKQVFIDSKLLEVSLEEGEDLGLRWNAQTKISSSGQRDQATGDIDANGTIATSTAPSLGLDRLFSFGVANANMDVVLEALGTRRRVDLRSNPRVLVMNHRTASIVVGQEIPYLSTVESTGATEPIRTYEFKEVAVRLDVTPHVSDDGIVFLDVHPTVKSVIGYTDDPRQPILSVREAATNVAVRDGETLIIGGLVQRSVSKQRSEVPFMARIPLIGLLFRQKSESDVKNDLLFLLSPRVLDEAVMADVRKSQANPLIELPPHHGEDPNSKTKW